MARNISFAPGQWYHCFNRGVDKRTIFMNYGDYKRFQMLLYASNSGSSTQISNFGRLSPESIKQTVYSRERGDLLVDIGAYALMPNHYHLLMRERVQGGITTFMRRLNTGYAMYFNARYERTGPLFSGKFKALHINTDEYLKRVVNYIHGNPTELFEHKFKSGMVQDAQLLQRSISTYEFASLSDYEEGRRQETVIVSREVLNDCLDEAPSIEGVIEDFKTFYAPSHTNGSILWT